MPTRIRPLSKVIACFPASAGPLAAPGTSRPAFWDIPQRANWSGGVTEKFFTDAFAALKPGACLAW